MQRTFIMKLVCCVLLAACAASEQPLAPEPPVAQQAPTAAPIQTQTAESSPAAATAAPSVTPLPYGKRLREVWPVAENRQSAITALLYSSIAPSDNEYRSRINVFWRTDLNDLNNRQKIAEITTDRGLDVSIFGQLSPDATHITYLKPIGDGLGDLHIIRSDGSNDQRVVTRIASTGGMCHRSFVWSLDGQQLAFVENPIQDELYGNQISVYDLRANSIIGSIKVGWAFLVGWQTPQNVLAITSSGQGQPRVLDTIDPISKERQAVATLPAQGFYCSNPAPDRQRILLDLDTGSYVFNINTKAFQKMNASASAAVWNPDSATVLNIGYNTQGNGRISKMTQDPLSAQSVLLADNAPSPWQGLLSASPDGRYLAVCEGRKIEPKGTLYRTMLYNIPDDQWTTLVDNDRCIKVLGWQ